MIDLYMTKYMAAFLNDSDAPFETAAFCTWGLEETFLFRWLVGEKVVGEIVT